MGMFNYIKCEYPLNDNFFGKHTVFQTKSIDPDFCDLYIIREDGQLMYEEHDIEDRSEKALWEKDNPGKEAPPELDGLCGCMTKVNKRLVEHKFTGCVVFYDFDAHGELIDFKALFKDGKLQGSIDKVVYAD